MPGSHIAEAIGQATGQPFPLRETRSAGGGCINQADLLIGQDGRRFFVKRNAPDRLAMFEAEAAGLTALAAARAIRVPQPVCTGQSEGQAFLVLEYLALGGSGSDALLAEQLAALHRSSAAHFGWTRDNTIGATHQPNPPTGDWIEFWRTQRLGYQLRLAEANGAPASLLDQGARLQDALPAFFVGYRPAPALLHGDLWGGNYGFADGQPVLFDPAVYYGDREADLAMTELFGGFSRDFYADYQAAWPMDPGYRVRKTLYNLYHILNHFNLFGGSYAAQALRMTESLLAEMR